MLSKIDKRKQPELRKFNFRAYPISGKLLFDTKKNVGWPKLETLTFRGYKSDN